MIVSQLHHRLRAVLKLPLREAAGELLRLRGEAIQSGDLLTAARCLDGLAARTFRMADRLAMRRELATELPEGWSYALLGLAELEAGNRKRAEIALRHARDRLNSSDTPSLCETIDDALSVLAEWRRGRRRAYEIQVASGRTRLAVARGDTPDQARIEAAFLQRHLRASQKLGRRDLQAIYARGLSELAGKRGDSVLERKYLRESLGPSSTVREIERVAHALAAAHDASAAKRVMRVAIRKARANGDAAVKRLELCLEGWNSPPMRRNPTEIELIDGSGSVVLVGR